MQAGSAADILRTETTFRLERWRALSSGVIETAASTFLLLIAVKWFHAGAFAKALVAGGGSIGLVAAPLIVTFVEHRGWTTSMAASRLATVGAISFLLPALIPSLPFFVLGSIAGMATASAAIPLLTQIYQENYPEGERGRRFSRTLLIRIGTAAAFSALAGRALTGRIELFQWLLLAFAGAFAFASVCLRRCPSMPLVRSGGKHPFRALRYAKEDRLFRLTLICWMLMGSATLMMHPLRVEYLANPKYSLALSAGMIALLTGVIPNLVRFVLSPVWGWLFDHMNFFALRVTLNIGFAVGILAFFLSNDLPGFILGAVIFGASNAGGDVAWSLWVTKFAPPERVADYMSVHTFFTGIRGLGAPMVAFYAAAYFSMTVLGWVAAGMILAATLLLVPEIKNVRAARRAPALVEEVSE